MTTKYISGTNGLWDEWSMVRMVYTWYEKSVVRIVNGTKSPDTVRVRLGLLLYGCRLFVECGTLWQFSIDYKQHQFKKEIC